MIITGAPVELLDFEDVNYWKEITGIFDWAKTHVTSTFFICWAAQAGLYHYYGIPKYPLDSKMFGIFEHRLYDPQNPIFRGFDDVFYVPHSRHTEIRSEDILKRPELTLLSESPESGVYMASKKDKMPHQLSGGEQQHIVIARALLNSPEIILADEPTGNLDNETANELVELLYKIRTSGTTIIMDKYEQIISYKADSLINNRRLEIEIPQSAPLSPGNSGKVVYHKVKRGETISEIADRYGVSVSKIKKWNHIRKSVVKKGQRIKIIK